MQIPWTAKRTIACIIDEIGESMSLENKVKKLKLSYFGHVIRDEKREKVITIGMVDGQRKRGMRRKRWLYKIKEVTGLSLQALHD